jgi:hypothetical protein
MLNSMTDSSAVETREIVRTEITEVLRCYCEALPAPERQDEFASFFDRFADARIVLLGEATHGTSEFYRARAAITERLISHHGFAFVAVEADWPDAAIHRGNRTSFPEVSRPGFSPLVSSSRRQSRGGKRIVLPLARPSRTIGMRTNDTMSDGDIEARFVVRHVGRRDVTGDDGRQEH